MEAILYSACNRFENLFIKSLTLKTLYFIMMQVFNVQYLSLLSLIPCELFSDILMGKGIIEKIVKIIIGNQIASFFVMVLILVMILLILYVAVLNESEVASKAAFIILIIIQQLSGPLCIIALSMITNH